MVVARKIKFNVVKASCVRTLRQMYQFIRKNRILIGICFIAFLLYTAISVLKHVHFESTGYDLTIFDQAVRGYSHFQVPSSSFRGFHNLLGDHFHPILALLAPLYWAADTPIMLLIAQALLVLSAVPAIYLFAKKRLDPTTALLFVLVFCYIRLYSELLRLIFMKLLSQFH